MSLEPFYERKKSKYSWTDYNFDKWCKEQAKELRGIGFNTGTAGVTRVLLNRIIIPNQIKITDLVNEKLKIKRKK